MYEYPIFTNLIQFSKLFVDGKLIKHDPIAPAPAHYGTNPKNEDSGSGEGNEDYDEDGKVDGDDYEGGQNSSVCESS